MSENENKSGLFKKVSPNSKSTKRLKKIFSFLLVAYIIAIVLLYTKNKYAHFSDNILEKIGSGIETNLTIEKTIRIKELSVDKYKKYLINHDYESAYNMLTDEYKKYCDYEKYTAYAQAIDWSKLEVEDINAKNDYCYVAHIIFEEDEPIKTRYLLFVNKYAPENFFISPDDYVYSYRDQEFKKDDILLHIDECVISINDVKLNGYIENISWFSDITINEVNIGLGDSMEVNNELKSTIKKGEKLPLSIEYAIKSDFFIPDNVSIKKEDGDKTVEYSFYFKENK